MKNNFLIDAVIITLGIIAVVYMIDLNFEPKDGTPSIMGTGHEILITDSVYVFVNGNQYGVREFQESLGFTGKDVDGTVGHKTIEAALYLNSLERTDD